LLGGVLGMIAFVALGSALPAVGPTAGSADDRPVQFTPEQTRWLAGHPVVRLACDPQWPPFSFDDGRGRLVGLDVDLVRMIEQRLGLRFVRVPAANWSEAYRMGKAREVDVLSGMARTGEREQHFLFTAAYLTQSFGIITRSDGPFLATLNHLAGWRVAVVPDHAVTERLRTDQPGAILVSAANTEQALRLVARGEADAVLTDLVNASYLIKTRGLANLKIAGIANYRFELRFAVRRDWPELVGILDAAIAAREPAGEQAVIDRWVRVDYADMARWASVWRVLALATAGGLLVVTAVFWHNRRLRRELAERRRVEAVLRAMRDRLEELNAEKTQLLDMAAHDLRNPLTGVMLSLEAVDTDDRGERRRVIHEVTALTRHMVQLINDLLDVQMLENGRRALHLVALDPADVVREVMAENRLAAARKRISLVFEPPEASVCVQADAGALHQVIDNLLSNAIKYSPVGGGVWVSVERREATVCLAVRDQGPGISHADMRRLFTKYARLGARPTAGESSVGLGLAIVRQLAEAMGGKVACQTGLGRGATFTVSLPAAEATLRPSERDLLREKRADDVFAAASE
jgi:signal transduction histidine kinase